MEIAAVVRSWRPDLLLAVGGGSVIDGTKFIALAAKVDTVDAAWRIVTDGALNGASVIALIRLVLPTA
jgi:alcohol dehydrogenase YqhD (iron-dependent ADH family)